MVSHNLEADFYSIKNQIDRNMMVGAYDDNIGLIQKAMLLCDKIYSQTSDPQMKEVMKENAGKLQNMYNTCKSKVEGKEITIGDPEPKPPVQPVRQAPGGAKQQPVGAKSTNGGDKKSQETEGEKAPLIGKDGKEVNYVINGVNVEDFLSKDSNDVVTFDDVKGMEEEKELIEREFFLTEEDRAFNAYLGKKPKTFILLYGVPGTGKTFFAKAISQELKNRSEGDVPFFSVIGSQLSDCKVGATEKNIQAVFEFCKQFEHCVLFIDEFDTIAPDRKQANGDPTAGSRVTVLLQMMDGFSSSAGTLVIAATNCPYNLDGAILSRANTRIEIPLPSYEVIYATLYSKIGKNLAPDVDLPTLAARLDGYSNRDVKNFIGAMTDKLSDQFRRGRRMGDTRKFEEFKYTNDMIEAAFKEIVPTTKMSDVERIEQFKMMGE
jgi:SpoVK/Ycf46/Vps4 family AAA+-type ATPase